MSRLWLFKYFEEDEKVVKKVDTLGRIQKVMFLTEIGLYHLIGRTNN